MKNEKGFAYPISLSIFVFFSMFLVIAVEQNLTEKRFNKETETILLGEYYLLSSLKKTEELISNDGLQNSGVFKYTKGEVTYQRKVLSPTVDEITLTLKLATNEQWVAIVHYDKVQQKMVKWVEWN